MQVDKIKKKKKNHSSSFFFTMREESKKDEGERKEISHVNPLFNYSNNNKIEEHDLEIEDNDNEPPYTVGTSLFFWAKIETSGEHPNGRGRPSLTIYQDKLYVFGGHREDNVYLGDFHVLDLKTKIWSPINSVEQPTARSNHTSVVYDHKMYLFGGYSQNSALNDIYSYNFEKKEWNKINILNSKLPAPRFCHSAVINNTSMYIFGGHNGSVAFNDLWEFDFTKEKWNEIKCEVNPIARCYHTAVIYKQHMIVFGGQLGTTRTNEIWNYSLKKKHWKMINTSGVLPPSRSRHICGLDIKSSKLYIFGGNGDTAGSYLDDLWEYNIKRNTWYKIPPKGVLPMARSQHSAVMYHNKVLIFGGRSGNSGDMEFLNDLYELNLEEDIPPETIHLDYKKLVNNEDFSDIQFICDGKKIYAHLLVISVRCSILASMFMNGMKETQTKVAEINDIPYDAFILFLEYLYTGRIELNKTVALHILNSSNKWCLPRLKAICEKYFAQNITVYDAIDVFCFSDLYNATNLRRISFQFIVDNFGKIMKEESFLFLAKEKPKLMKEIFNHVSDRYFGEK